MAQSPKISPKWGRVVTSCNSGCGIKAMTFGSTASMASAGGATPNPIGHAVEQLSNAVFPQASLGQLLFTLLLLGLVALLIGVPIARQRRHVQQFQKRIQERDQPDESSKPLQLKHRPQQAGRMIHPIRAQQFQLQQQDDMSREAKRRNDREAEAERAVHQSHGCSFERFSLR